MTTQNVYGTLVCTDNSEIPLSASLTDAAAAANVTTDTAFTVTAQNVGDYAPGKTVKAAIITSKTFIGYAYIIRQGLVAAVLPIASRTAGGSGNCSGSLDLNVPLTLMPGDQVLAYVDA
jgi:hypothetical protein